MKFNLSVFAFGVMSTVTVLFAACAVGEGLNIRMPELTQTGDTSLNPKSINWMVPLAFALAVLICLF